MQRQTQRPNLLRSAFVALALATSVSVAGCAPISGRQTAGEYVDDVTISTRVRTAILSEIGPGEVKVETMQGVVQLSGFVSSAQVKTKAGDIARGVGGVKQVKNDLIVR